VQLFRSLVTCSRTYLDRPAYCQSTLDILIPWNLAYWSDSSSYIHHISSKTDLANYDTVYVC